MAWMRFVTGMVCLLLLACNNKQEKKEAYVHVTEFFSGELSSLRTDTFEIYRQLQVDSGKAIPSATSFASVEKDITPFLVDDIKPRTFEKGFKEAAFADASTNSITFTYTSLNEDCPIQQVDVHVQPATETIDKVYITRNCMQGDTAVQQKILWIKGNHYSLYTQYVLGNYAKQTIEKISWIKKKAAP